MIDDATTRPSTSRLRFLQFSCKTLLLLTTLAGLIFAWWSDRREFRSQMKGLRDQMTVLQAASGYETWDDQTATGRFSIGPSGYPSYGAVSSRGTTLWTAIQFMDQGVPFAPPRSDEDVRGRYCELFRQKEGWLSENFADNQDWKDLLAAYPPESGHRSSFGSGPSYGTGTPYPSTQAPAVSQYTPPPTPADTGPRSQSATTSSPPPAKPKPATKIPIAKLLPAVRKLLRDGGSAERLLAIQYSDGLKPQLSEQLIPDLIRVLDDKNHGVRAEAASFLQRLEPASKPALPRLKKLMETNASYDAVIASAAIVRIDPRFDVVSELVVPRLTELVAGKDQIAGDCAETLLSELGRKKKAARAVPALFAMLKHKDSAVRERSARLLGGLAPRDRAIAALTAAVKKEKNAEVKTAMARIVLRLQGGTQPPVDSPPDPLPRVPAQAARVTY